MSFAVSRPRIAVVGAGLAGLACARELKARNARVTVFESGRAAGGRVATLRSALAPFDQGAQYFTVQHHRFEAALEPLRGEAVVQRCNGRVIAFTGGRSTEQSMSAERRVGVPAMAALPRRFAAGLDVPFGVRIGALERPSGIDFDGAFVNGDAALGWFARDDRKPQRPAVEGVAERWVLHAHPAWSRRHFAVGGDGATRRLADAIAG